VKQDRSVGHLDGAIRILPVAFLVIIAGFVLGNLLALVSARRTQAANRRISENAIVSIEEVSRIVHDIDLERLLINEHIFETSLQEMDPLEVRISQVQANLSGAAQEYQPLTTFPAQREIWLEMWEDVDELHQPIRHVLELSRDNRDVEARKALSALEKRFDEINQKAEQLVQINREDARNVVAEIQALQRRTLTLFAGITLGGTLLASFVAVWVMQLVKRRDRQIAEATLLLEQRNEELDAFAGRVAHDLRGPLTAINLSTLRLSEQIPEGDGALTVLQRGVARMDALIRDLLTLSRAGAEAPATIANTTVIASTLEDELISKVDSVNGVLRIDLEPADVRCSEVLLRQVLWNIGENAVKYRRSDVRLEIGIQGRKAGLSYQIRVSDNGTGMSADDAARVFDPFYRASAARSTPGTGLGLSIVKRVIEASGGQVSVTSELGRGTTFDIALPLASTAQKRWESGGRRAI
jgi:signal transduction histidine kinase